MRNDVFWRSIKIGDLFCRDTKLAHKKNQKDLDLSLSKDNEHNVALVSASRDGSGCVGYLSINDYDINQVSINKITFDDQWGYTFFQKEPFIITGGHNAILELKNIKLKSVLDKNLQSYSFLSLLINKITIKSKLYGYGYKINNKLDRELITLPMVKVDSSEDAIWEIDGAFFSLATDYIQLLIEKAREVKKAKEALIIIKEFERYQTLKAKYEASMAEFEPGYLSEKSSIKWVAFKLDDLFERISPPSTNVPAKLLEIFDAKIENRIALVARGSINKGVVGYIDPQNHPIEKNKITYNDQFGLAYFHEYDFTTIKDHISILKPRSEYLADILSCKPIIGGFICQLINKIFTKEIFSFSYNPSDFRFGREVILLPLIEIKEAQVHLYQIQQRNYVLAESTIHYLYYSGRISAVSRKIDNPNKILKEELNETSI